MAADWPAVGRLFSSSACSALIPSHESPPQEELRNACPLPGLFPERAAWGKALLRGVSVNPLRERVGWSRNVLPGFQAVLCLQLALEPQEERNSDRPKIPCVHQLPLEAALSSLEQPSVESAI